MTTNRAIEVLSSFTSDKHYTIALSEIQEACKCGAKALQKNVKVSPRYDQISWWHMCGECGGKITPNDNFCKHCGQAIEWTV